MYYIKKSSDLIKQGDWNLIHLLLSRHLVCLLSFWKVKCRSSKLLINSQDEGFTWATICIHFVTFTDQYQWTVTDTCGLVWVSTDQSTGLIIQPVRELCGAAARSLFVVLGDVNVETEKFTVTFLLCHFYTVSLQYNLFLLLHRPLSDSLILCHLSPWAVSQCHFLWVSADQRWLKTGAKRKKSQWCT